MTTLRHQAGQAARALLKVLLFSALFLLLQGALSVTLASWAPGAGFVLQTLATLLAALAAGWLLLAAFDHKPPAALGFALRRKAWREVWLGVALGAGGLLIASALLMLVGGLRFRHDTGTLLGWLRGALTMLLVLLIPAAAEESLFRGYPFQKLVEGFGAPIATAAVSVAFAMAHARNPGISRFALANIGVAGVMLSVAFLATRSLWFVTGVHVGWNWCMAALLDLPVSGLHLYDAPLYDAVDRSPAWLGGGAFGPEAGLTGLTGLLLVLAGVIWLTRKKQWLT